MPLVSRLSVVAMSLFLVSGCALLQTMSEGSKMQSIAVVAPLAEGTKCKVTDARGNRYKVHSTPEVIVVRQGFSPLTFICEKPGYKKNVSYLDDDRLMHSTVNLPDELAGMVDKPFARVATEYPREVAIWMKPIKWRSEKHMREWAFEKSLYDHKLYLLEQKKLAAYKKLEEERKYFKNWANNKKDKWERKEAEKYSGMNDGLFTRQEKVDEFDAFMEEWGELKARFEEVWDELTEGNHAVHDADIVSEEVWEEEPYELHAPSGMFPSNLNAPEGSESHVPYFASETAPSHYGRKAIIQEVELPSQLP